MVTRSKLRSALAAEKGVDFSKLKQQKKAKETAKRKALKAGSKDREDEDEGASDIEVEEDQKKMNLDAIYESDTSESSIELEKRLPRKPTAGQQNSKSAAVDQEEDEDEEEDEEEIPVSDLEDLEEDEKEDIVPHTRLTINNTSALLAALDRISIPTDKTVPFATHQSVVSSAQTTESIPDVSDDLQRELAFYSQCLEAVRVGRSRLISEGVLFSRPKDYFAEMVKEDAHMEKIKAKLVEEASAKKAAAEARKLRDLKKFGKQVQVSKLQERQKAKREVLDKIKTLKRKRQEHSSDVGTKEADIFDVSVDNEIAKHSQRSGSGRQQSGTRPVNAKRQKKNEKYGFGGKKRHAKSGDAMSSGDLSRFNVKKMKAKSSRPGKSRRKAAASK
ncbi:eukaryotic rRNA processing protein EBP2 domain-containing protein [Trichoderma breve]|uniref:Eukaryotic rRNA processing protein EBP2 domain-containing protein n=1 Tax=Trichoderma breve TaxID=2034170 RepID=A0A9W9B4X0_9HYPO|nr:eukaryotic rRNA processing protein EBP2 domain-containing protein [Trichoderma breve]KAJ4856377.1 eukaryotic rRNA processing protein EBP2 domain-containing protein [Trichoderma breve]